MKNLPFVVVSALLSLAVPASCQRGRAAAPYYEDTNNIPISPEIHPDRAVTFRLFAPKASEVVLMGSPGILEVIKEPKPLMKDDKGVWTQITLPVALPSMRIFSKTRPALREDNPLVARSIPILRSNFP